MSAKSTKGSAPEKGALRAKQRRVAVRDPENPPLTKEECDGMRQLAPVKDLRWKLNMSQEAFAASYGIPLAKLVAWEQREAEPTETELAYLRAIERNPEVNKLVPA